MNNPLFLEDMDFARAIKEARLSAHISRGELASLAGVTANAVSNWEHGRTRPELNTLRRVMYALGCDANAFFRLKSKPTPKGSALLNDFNRLSARDARLVRSLISEMLSEEDEYADFPFSPLGICAGDGQYLADDVPEETIRIKKSPLTERGDFAVRVSGSSMEPKYFDGDIIIIQRATDIEIGEIGAFLVDGEGTLKQKQPDGLYPLNPGYRPIFPGEYTDLRCVGLVLGTASPEGRMP